MSSLVARLEHHVIPAVPVPFRGDALDLFAQRRYARWMSTQPVPGVAVWSHTGRGPHLSPEQRRQVLAAWREALPGKIIIAGARDAAMARDARQGGADALLAFPARDDPVRYHRALGGELPVLAFYLYEAAGGVSYDDATLRAILELPSVIGIKVATLDSVMTFQRIARLMRSYPEKLLVTGEDRFLGYSLMLGARSALIGMGAALTDVQAGLLRAHAERDWSLFHRISAQCDEFAQVAFVPPMEGYVRRMLWALAADDVLPEAACDDPWGPALDRSEREAVEHFVRDARASRA